MLLQAAICSRMMCLMIYVQSENAGNDNTKLAHDARKVAIRSGAMNLMIYIQSEDAENDHTIMAHMMLGRSTQDDVFSKQAGCLARRYKSSITWRGRLKVRSRLIEEWEKTL